jgi:hypothetical protein
MSLSKILNYITLKTGARPHTYGIFVWIRQVNDRLLRLENNKEQGTISQRAEFEAYVEAQNDKLVARIDVLEQRIGELEQAVFALSEKTAEISTPE